MSVAALTPTSVMAFAASRFSMVIQRMASDISGGEPRRRALRSRPPLEWERYALTRMPFPSGFVRIKASPTSAVEFRTTRSMATVPVTARPYFGTSSMMV